MFRYLVRGDFPYKTSYFRTVPLLHVCKIFNLTILRVQTEIKDCNYVALPQLNGLRYHVDEYVHQNNPKHRKPPKKCVHLHMSSFQNHYYVMD